ncbi:MAG: hypothetical protein ACI8RA_001379 [Chlamydiales bacterium]|jgi:hypothetical protein
MTLFPPVTDKITKKIIGQFTTQEPLSIIRIRDISIEIVRSLRYDAEKSPH